MGYVVQDLFGHCGSTYGVKLLQEKWSRCACAVEDYKVPQSSSIIGRSSILHRNLQIIQPYVQHDAGNERETMWGVFAADFVC